MCFEIADCFSDAPLASKYGESCRDADSLSQLPLVFTSVAILQLLRQLNPGTILIFLKFVFE